MNRNITIIDSIMGSGKTNKAIDIINNTDKILYVTPFCDEITRIHKNCSNIFCDWYVDDNEDEIINKTIAFGNLVENLIDNKKIAITHSLFKRLPLGNLKILKDKGYTLILDEILECISPINISSKTIDMMCKSNYISIDDETGYVIWNGLDNRIEFNGNHFEFEQVKQWAKENRLILINNIFYFWQFPPHIFEQFNQVYILTYKFEYSLMKYYFQKFDIGYKLKSIKDNEIVDFYEPDLDKYKELIKISFPKQKRFDISYSSKLYHEFSKADTKVVKNMKQDYFTLLSNIRFKYNYKKDDLMWTVFNVFKNEIVNNKKIIAMDNETFVPCNCRSTNKYASKTKLIYLIDVYLNPIIKNHYFQKININEEGYALIEMLQWIWRSAIRNDNPISIYILSKRMRMILEKWLNKEL